MPCKSWLLIIINDLINMKSASHRFLSKRNRGSHSQLAIHISSISIIFYLGISQHNRLLHCRYNRLIETFVGTLWSACVLQRGIDTLGSPSCLLVTKCGHLRRFQLLSKETFIIWIWKNDNVRGNGVELNYRVVEYSSFNCSVLLILRG